MTRTLTTRKGDLAFPAFLPVTTFGAYPLDDLVRPYLPRLARGLMVSYHYARQMGEFASALPIFADSGGFASLFGNASVSRRDGLGVISVETEGKVEEITPPAVLELQGRVADAAFTLDFPIPPGMEAAKARERFELTLANADWALSNNRRRDLPLYACVQAWDVGSAREAARHYAAADSHGRGFAGVAIGGLVPRVKDRDLVLAIVGAVRAEVGELPLHVFGIGKPDLLQDLFAAGADSVDSSNYVQYAAEGRLLGRPEVRIGEPTVTDRLHLALLNLAACTGRTLPLGFAETVFHTAALEAGPCAMVTAPYG